MPPVGQVWVLEIVKVGHDTKLHTFLKDWEESVNLNLCIRIKDISMSFKKNRFTKQQEYM